MTLLLLTTEADAQGSRAVTIVRCRLMGLPEPARTGSGQPGPAEPAQETREPVQMTLPHAAALD